MSGAEGGGAEFAPAKVNLFLHVGPLRADGFHPLSSLMVFADVGDRLRARPAEGFSLELTGPFAAQAPPGGDNLVARAVRALAAQAGVPIPDLRLVLDKQLPAGAGLGGGSSDAAAVLRLLGPGLGVAGPDLYAIAALLGSDVPACLVARPLLAQGRGERLTPWAGLPDLPVVLARPPEAAATAAVFRAFDALPPGAGAEHPPQPARLDSPQAAAAFLAGGRNDLEAPAVAVEPSIGEVLAALRGEPESLLARMSGSGSACFAICRDAAAADAMASRLAAARPGWWVRACRLQGS